MKSLIAILILLTCQCIQAIVIFGTGDPEANVVPPVGFGYVGQFGSFCGTAVSPQWFVAARHVGGQVGQEFKFDGVPYTTVAVVDDPINSDIRLWKIDGSLPRWAPMLSTWDCTGRPAILVGRGAKRGAHLAGCEEVSGWVIGSFDGRMRWGTNLVAYSGNYIAFPFLGRGFDEGCATMGDSSGAILVLDLDNTWKLGAVISYVTPLYVSDGPTQLIMGGAWIDARGLWDGQDRIPCDDPQISTWTYGTAIAPRITWIQSVTE